VLDDDDRQLGRPGDGSSMPNTTTVSSMITSFSGSCGTSGLPRLLEALGCRRSVFSDQAKTFARTFARVSHPELILGDLR
jgi:hypothetical protein